MIINRKETSKEDRQRRRREEVEEESRDLQDLHLQSLEAGTPGYWDLLKGDVDHELVH